VTVYEVLEHTTDVRLRVDAADREELFREAVAALMTSMKAHAHGMDADRETIVLDGPDLTALLVDFLGEILLRAHIGQRAYEVIDFAVLTNSELEATVEGRAAVFAEDVKAVTYHEADVRESGGRWTTNLILDI
jgi:SHS2 domain-containing protein